MKLLSLVWSNFVRNRARLTFTLIALISAFALYGMRSAIGSVFIGSVFIGGGRGGGRLFSGPAQCPGSGRGEPVLLVRGGSLGAICDEDRATERGTVGFIVAMLDKGVDPAQVAGKVDELFGIMRFFAYPLLLGMSIGAVFACLNTMYGAVAARTREIGVARSIGFGAPAVALGVLVESVLLSLSGGISGVVLIRLALNGIQTNTNFPGDAQFAFSLIVPAALMLQGVLWAAVIGLLGGLLPAVRAGRRPIVEALRVT